VCPKMVPKERARTALEHREPDRVPIFEPWMHTIIIEKILHRPFAGVNDMIDCYKKLEIDFVPISFGAPKGWKPKFLDDKVFVDEWGRKWRYQKGAIWDMFGFYIEGTINTPEKFDEFEFPDPLAPGRIDDLEIALKAVGNEYAVMGAVDQGIFERAETMVGLEKLLLYMYEKPSFVRKVLEEHYKFSLELGKRCLDAGAEFILIGDDIADNHGPFMPPKLYEQFVHPYSKSLVQSLKKRGAKVIRHTDGNLKPIMNYILDLGIDGLHPIQPEAGMDITELKRTYGDRLTLVGGVDVAKLLPFASEDEVEKEVIDVIRKVSPGGGHILASTNSLHSFVPDIDKFVKNVLRYVETAHKYGVYPIKS